MSTHISRLAALLTVVVLIVIGSAVNPKTAWACSCAADQTPEQIPQSGRSGVRG